MPPFVTSYIVIKPDIAKLIAHNRVIILIQEIHEKNKSGFRTSININSDGI